MILTVEDPDSVFEQAITAGGTVVAAVYEGASLTYRELDEHAELLARHLRGMCAGPESRVGIFMERSLEMLLERRIEGLVVVANWLLVDINLLADLEKRRLPTAIIGRDLKPNSVSSVMVDNEAGARLAIEHLHGLGHRNIAFIRGPKALADSALRWKGIRAFARVVKLLQIQNHFPDAVALPGWNLSAGQFVEFRRDNVPLRELRFRSSWRFHRLAVFAAVSEPHCQSDHVPESGAPIGDVRIFDDPNLARE